MRVRVTVLLLLLGTGLAAAQSRPLQRPAKAPETPATRVELHAPVPPIEPMQTEIVLPPSACRLRLSPELAEAPSIPPRAGPSACGGEDLVRLEAVHLPDTGRVALSPPAVLRCEMAEALVDWVRGEIPPLATGLGAPIAALDNFSSYECRGRNNVFGAKLSEHGKANAFDLRGFKLANGKLVDLTNVSFDRDVRERVRGGLCGRFTTVLGPGSDRYHENHIHLDLAQRRGGYRMCQWDVRDPPQIASVPLPTPRPKPTDTVDANADPMAAPPVAAQTRPSQQPEGAKSGEVRVALRSAGGPGNKAATANTVEADAADNAAARARGGMTGVSNAAAAKGSSPGMRATDGSGNVSPPAKPDGTVRNQPMLSDRAGNRLDRARQRRSGG